MRPQGIAALLGGRSPLGCGEQTQLLLCCGCPVLLLLERVHGVNHKPDALPEEKRHGERGGGVMYVGRLKVSSFKDRTDLQEMHTAYAAREGS